jgi:hypothetical protein
MSLEETTWKTGINRRVILKCILNTKVVKMIELTMDGHRPHRYNK